MKLTPTGTPKLLSSPPLGWLARRAMLRRVADRRPDGRLDIRLPDGYVVALGNGERPQATITVHDDRAFVRMMARGELGAGEAFTAREWDADDLPTALRWFLRATQARGVESNLSSVLRMPTLWRHHRAHNDRSGSTRNITAHYDLGNDFYRTFLDEQMVYSCAMWRGATSLAQAQHHKLEHLCRLADLQPGDHVLEIGCGWGALALHAARTRGCRVTAITASPAQLAVAQARAQAEGLADRVRFELCDYRDIDGTYDAVLSCEMLEAVGYQYLPRYFSVVAARLRAGRRAVIQSITMPDDRFDQYLRSVDWMQTYIFPGSLIPSLSAITGAMIGTGLTITEREDIGPDYAFTLAAWRSRFVAALPTVKALGFDDSFVRAWLLYLGFSEAAFAERTLADHQLVLTRT